MGLFCALRGCLCRRHVAKRDGIPAAFALAYCLPRWQFINQRMLLAAWPKKHGFLVTYRTDFYALSDPIGGRLRHCVCLRQASSRLRFKNHFLLFLLGIFF